MPVFHLVRLVTETSGTIYLSLHETFNSQLWGELQLTA